MKKAGKIFLMLVVVLALVAASRIISLKIEEKEELDAIKQREEAAQGAQNEIEPSYGGSGWDDQTELPDNQIIDLEGGGDVYAKLVSNMPHIEGCCATLLYNGGTKITVPSKDNIRKVLKYTRDGVLTEEDGDAAYYMIWSTNTTVRCETIASSGGASVGYVVNGAVAGFDHVTVHESVPVMCDVLVPKDEVWEAIKKSGYSGSTDDGYCVKVMKLDKVKINGNRTFDVKTEAIYGLADGQIIGKYKGGKAILSSDVMGSIDESAVTVVNTGKSSELMYELKSNGLLEIYPLDESDFEGSDNLHNIIFKQFNGNFEGIIAVKVHEGVTVLEDGLFSNMNYIENVQLPNTLTVIGSSTFSSCEQLREITIPESVTEIDSFAFSGSGLERIVIPDSVIKIGNSAFQGCRNLSDVHFSENLQVIGKQAFLGCGNLSKIDIPMSVVELYSEAFQTDRLDYKEIIIHQPAMDFLLRNYKDVTVDDKDSRKKENAMKSIKLPLGIFKCNATIHYDGSNFDTLKELVGDTAGYTCTWINDAG